MLLIELRVSVNSANRAVASAAGSNTGGSTVVDTHTPRVDVAATDGAASTALAMSQPIRRSAKPEPTGQKQEPF